MSSIVIKNLTSATVFDDTPGATVETFTVTDPDTAKGDHLVVSVSGTYASYFTVVASGSSYILELKSGAAGSLPDTTPSSLNLTITATDYNASGGIVSSYAAVSQTIAITTHVPTITVNTPAPATIYTDYPFLDVLPSNTFVDPEGNSNLTYTATQINSSGASVALPSWLHFYGPLDAFYGQPVYANGNDGTYTLQVTATDSVTHKTASTTFTLTVAPDPIETNTIPNVAVNEGTAVSDALTTGFELAPNYASSILSQLSALGFTPNITIPSANMSTEFLNTDPATYSNTHYGLTLSATISGPAGAPAWLTFNPTTDTFSGTPTSYLDKGAYTITVTATNGQTGVSASDTFTVTVNEFIPTAPALNFGSIQNGSHSTMTEVITLNGDTIPAGDISISGTNASNFTLGTVTTTSTTESVPITFTATGIGTESANLVVLDKYGLTTDVALLSGTALEAIASISTPTAINQPIHTTSLPEALTVTDTGNEALNGISVSILPSTYSGDFAIAAGGTLGSSLGINGSGIIDVTFKPSTTGVNEMATLQITSTDGATQDVTLSGMGLSPITVPVINQSLNEGQSGPTTYITGPAGDMFHGTVTDTESNGMSATGAIGTPLTLPDGVTVTFNTDGTLALDTSAVTANQTTTDTLAFAVTDSYGVMAFGSGTFTVVPNDSIARVSLPSNMNTITSTAQGTIIGPLTFTQAAHHPAELYNFSASSGYEIVQTINGVVTPVTSPGVFNPSHPYELAIGSGFQFPSGPIFASITATPVDEPGQSVTLAVPLSVVFTTSIGAVTPSGVAVNPENVLEGGSVVDQSINVASIDSTDSNAGISNITYTPDPRGNTTITLTLMMNGQEIIDLSDGLAVNIYATTPNPGLVIAGVVQPDPSNQTLIDTFNYTVTDKHGGTAPGTDSFAVIPNDAINSITLPSGMNVITSAAQGTIIGPLILTQAAHHPGELYTFSASPGYEIVQTINGVVTPVTSPGVFNPSNPYELAVGSGLQFPSGPTSVNVTATPVDEAGQSATQPNQSVTVPLTVSPVFTTSATTTHLTDGQTVLGFPITFSSPDPNDALAAYVSVSALSGTFVITHTGATATSATIPTNILLPDGADVGFISSGLIIFNSTNIPEPTTPTPTIDTLGYTVEDTYGNFASSTISFVITDTPVTGGQTLMTAAATGVALPTAINAASLFHSALPESFTYTVADLMNLTTHTDLGANVLPAGLSLNASTGAISGTPTNQSASYAITIQAETLDQTSSATSTVDLTILPFTTGVVSVPAGAAVEPQNVIESINQLAVLNQVTITSPDPTDTLMSLSNVAYTGSAMVTSNTTQILGSFGSQTTAQIIYLSDGLAVEFFLSGVPISSTIQIGTVGAAVDNPTTSNQTVIDTFTYTVTDSHGGTAPGTDSFAVVPNDAISKITLPSNMNNITSETQGTIIGPLTFTQAANHPGELYTLSASPGYEIVQTINGVVTPVTNPGVFNPSNPYELAIGSGFTLPNGSISASVTATPVDEAGQSATQPNEAFTQTLPLNLGFTTGVVAVIPTGAAVEPQNILESSNGIAVENRVTISSPDPTDTLMSLSNIMYTGSATITYEPAPLNLNGQILQLIDLSDGLEVVTYLSGATINSTGPGLVLAAIETPVTSNQTLIDTFTYNVTDARGFTEPGTDSFAIVPNDAINSITIPSNINTLVLGHSPFPFTIIGPLTLTQAADHPGELYNFSTSPGYVIVQIINGEPAVVTGPGIFNPSDPYLLAIYNSFFPTSGPVGASVTATPADEAGQSATQPNESFTQVLPLVYHTAINQSLVEEQAIGPFTAFGGSDANDTFTGSISVQETMGSTTLATKGINSISSGANVITLSDGTVATLTVNNGFGTVSLDASRTTTEPTSPITDTLTYTLLDSHNIPVTGTATFTLNDSPHEVFVNPLDSNPVMHVTEGQSLLIDISPLFSSDDPLNFSIASVPGDSTLADLGLSLVFVTGHNNTHILTIQGAISVDPGTYNLPVLATNLDNHSDTAINTIQFVVSDQPNEITAANPGVTPAVTVYDGQIYADAPTNIFSGALFDGSTLFHFLDPSEIIYSATGLPSGLSIDSQTGLIYGSEPTGAVFSATIQIIADDGDDAADGGSDAVSVPVSLTFAPPPSFTVTIPGMDAELLSPISFNFTPDGIQAPQTLTGNTFITINTQTENVVLPLSAAPLVGADAAGGTNQVTLPLPADTPSFIVGGDLGNAGNGGSGVVGGVGQDASVTYDLSQANIENGGWLSSSATFGATGSMGATGGSGENVAYVIHGPQTASSYIFGGDEGMAGSGGNGGDGGSASYTLTYAYNTQAAIAYDIQANQLGGNGGDGGTGGNGGIESYIIQAGSGDTTIIQGNIGNGGLTNGSVGLTGPSDPYYSGEQVIIGGNPATMDPHIVDYTYGATVGIPNTGLNSGSGGTGGSAGRAVYTITGGDGNDTVVAGQAGLFNTGGSYSDITLGNGNDVVYLDNIYANVEGNANVTRYSVTLGNGNDTISLNELFVQNTTTFHNLIINPGLGFNTLALTGSDSLDLGQLQTVELGANNPIAIVHIEQIDLLGSNNLSLSHASGDFFTQFNPTLMDGSAEIGGRDILFVNGGSSNVVNLIPDSGSSGHWFDAGNEAKVNGITYEHYFYTLEGYRGGTDAFDIYVSGIPSTGVHLS